MRKFNTYVRLLQVVLEVSHHAHVCNVLLNNIVMELIIL